MKVRNGFVSNSSSSSFVVAMNKGASTKVKIELEFDLKDIKDRTILTVEQLNEYVSEMYGSVEDFCEYSKKEYNEYKRQLKSGRVLLICNASSEGDCAAELVLYEGNIKKMLKNNDNIKVIDDRG